MKGRLGKIRIDVIKMFISMFICVIGLSLLRASDAEATTFVLKVKGAGQFYHAVQATDGSYVSISSRGNTSCIVRKVSELGERIWERRLSFQIADGGFVFMHGIAQTNDGFVLVGWGRLGGYYDDGTGVIVRLRKNGTVRWSKTFQPPTSANEIVFDSVSSTADGGYIVAGHTFPGGTVLVKFTSLGEVLWSKSFKELSFNSRSQLVSDGLILAHIEPLDSESTSQSILKVSDSGNIVWQKALEIEGFHLHSLGPAAGDGVVLTGKSSNPQELILIGLKANGDLDWKASYSLKVPDFVISGLVKTSDGGYVIAGTKFNPETFSNTGGFVLRIDAKQNLVFQKTFGLSDTGEGAETVFATAEGGFTVFGSSGLNDMLVLSLNSVGVVPGCRFLHKLTAKKVTSPHVATENLQIGSEDFSLPTPVTVQIRSFVSKKRSSNACP